ncbi:chaperonin 10-like protein [Aspergillus pseudotamarii]|uniref:Chaperonin 10-like protein n=1 Tax=Aspergillus pseudotamarii TaxID=132259 RepID=A0A5N6SV87_ASPPS|nr:chaperonin 10-like protein [Aspergillus pseudotamarii]KAE8137807.1 chaperonin 10-like protein [Aspergillus pseudotamarii]
MANANIGLYADENATFRVRRGLEFPVPGDGELIIETQFSGVNPADVKHATQLGIYPAVLGYDFCGKVLRAPPQSSFVPGDTVAGYTPTGLNRPAGYGTHQRYLVCPEEMAFHVPANLPLQHAACLGVVAMTAADTLYNIFKFPPPDNGDTRKIREPVLIWGASSSVGLCAVQLARASGIYPIFVTASPQRHQLLLELGATQCFDYRSADVASQIESAVEEGHWDPIGYAFDAVGSYTGTGSANLMAECVSEKANLVSVVVQRDPRFKMPFATPNRDSTIRVHGAPHPITIPARPSDYVRAWKALQWAVANYGAVFRFPSVDVVKGTAETALEQVQAVGDGARGFGKLVLEHPLL